MRCLWVLAAVAAFLILLCITRVGVLLTFGEEFTLSIRFGVLHFRAVPSPKPKQEKKKAVKKAEKKETEKAKKPAEKFPKPTIDDIRSAWQALWPPFRKTLRRTGRSIRISPMVLSIVFGGSLDPAAAAEHYGEAQGAVWTIMPAAEQVMDIRSPAIHVGLDFEAEQMSIQGRIGVTLRIGTLLVCGIGMGIPALKWLMQYKKIHRQAAANKQEKQPSDRAA